MTTFGKTLVSVFVAVIIIGVGIFFLFQKKAPNTPSTPTGPVACTMEAKLCPDGSYVGRSGPNCEFAPCQTIPGSTASTSSATPPAPTPPTLE